MRIERKCRTIDGNKEYYFRKVKKVRKVKEVLSEEMTNLGRTYQYENHRFKRIIRNCLGRVP